jgi:hypothetical protein
MTYDRKKPGVAFWATVALVTVPKTKAIARKKG